MDLCINIVFISLRIMNTITFLNNKKKTKEKQRKVNECKMDNIKMCVCVCVFTLVTI